MSRPEIITAVPVAFHHDGSLDLEGSREILRFVARSGNEGAFVLGTTGEFPALSYEERGKLVEASLEELSEHMRVIVHVGAPSLYEVRRLIAQTKAAGAREIAVITPYYLTATETCLYDFYRAVSADADGLDVYVYVFRNRTGNPVTPQLMARLAELPNIVGAKVSEEPLELLAQYREVVPSGFIIYTGADREMARAGAYGAQGVISGVSSVLPAPFRALADAVEAGDEPAIATAQRDVDLVVDVVRGDMARMKVAYGMLGVSAGTVRMAIEAPDENALEQLRRAVDSFA